MIYNEAYVRGRIYSYLKFQKYMKEIADIFCEEFHLEKSEVQHVFLSKDGKTVYLRFDESEIGFSSEFLWDQNVRESFKKSFEVD